jgi:hypothetical protein
MKNIAAYVAIGIVVFVGLIFFGMKVSATNKAVSLENRASAKQDQCKLVYDGMWKTVQQKGQVASKYEDAFKEIFPQLIEGRYGNEKGGSLMKFIVESNPTFDPSMLKDLSRYIESSRGEYTAAQSVLRDIKREHDDLRLKFPSSMFVGGRAELKIVLVTSTQTEDIYKSGKEDNVDVFGGEKGK